MWKLLPPCIFVIRYQLPILNLGILIYFSWNELLYSYIYTSEKRKQQTCFSMRKKIKIRILRIGFRHLMNNILAFGPYWRAESLVGTTISQMMILLSRWRRIQTSKNGCDFDTLTAFMAWQLCFFCILHIQALQSNTSFYVSHQEVHLRFS